MEYWWVLLVILACAIFICIILSIANNASEKFVNEFKEASKKEINGDITITDFLHNINFSFFNGNLKVQEINSETDNFYSSKYKVIALSKNTLKSNSIASFSVIAHEAGHALQDLEGNKLKKMRIFRIIGKFLGVLFLPTFLISLILIFIGEKYFFLGNILLIITLLIFILALTLKAITISIEKDASKKGLNFLKLYLDEKDVKLCLKILKSAKLTYWGDFFRLLFAWTFLTKKTKLFN